MDDGSTAPAPSPGSPQVMHTRLLRLVADEAGNLWTGEVLMIGGHWLWAGTHDRDGYGVQTYEGRQWKAHRIVWSLLEGVLLPDEVLGNRCGFIDCVFPGHWRKFANQTELIRATFGTGPGRRRKGAAKPTGESKLTRQTPRRRV